MCAASYLARGNRKWSNTMIPEFSQTIENNKNRDLFSQEEEFVCFYLRFLIKMTKQKSPNGLTLFRVKAE